MFGEMLRIPSATDQAESHNLASKSHGNGSAAKSVSSLANVESQRLQTAFDLIVFMLQGCVLDELT